MVRKAGNTTTFLTLAWGFALDVAHIHGCTFTFNDRTLFFREDAQNGTDLTAAIFRAGDKNDAVTSADVALWCALMDFGLLAFNSHRILR